MNAPKLPLLISSSDEPKIIGIATKNENLDASSCFNPETTPPVIVDPERETPGSSEIIWKIPTKRASFKLISLSPRVLLFERKLARNRKNAVIRKR